MADTASFLHELARQIKRHPQSYPSWLCILADDVIEASGNVTRRESVAAPRQDDLEAALARRFLES
jgi:hypothetical protein